MSDGTMTIQIKWLICCWHKTFPYYKFCRPREAPAHPAQGSGPGLLALPDRVHDGGGGLLRGGRPRRRPQRARQPAHRQGLRRRTHQGHRHPRRRRRRDEHIQRWVNLYQRWRYRESRKGGPQVVWIRVKKLCSVFLLQAGERNFFTSFSHNLEPTF